MNTLKNAQSGFDSSTKALPELSREVNSHFVRLVLSRGIEPLSELPQSSVLSIERREDFITLHEIR